MAEEHKGKDKVKSKSKTHSLPTMSFGVATTKDGIDFGEKGDMKVVALAAEDESVAVNQ